MNTEAPVAGIPRVERARLTYLPGLDGLRALAVMAVFAYHADVGWAPGGFLGVDVFFVISGYLITALLLDEWQRTGTINMFEFWRRRALRLLPALVTMLVTVAAAAPLLAPEQVGRMAGDIRAALAYVSNWWLIFEDQSYFEAVGRPPLFQHLWSLAVEEQFYLLWPLVLPVLLRRKLKSLRLARYLVGAACFSALLMAVLYTPSADPSRAYYGTDTRLAAILIGAALASVWAPWRAPRHTPNSAGVFLHGVLVASVAGIGLMITNVDRYASSLYPGGFVGVAVLSALAIAVVVHPAGMPSGSLLGSRALLWVGRRSYGIYLWHWPVLMVTRSHLDVPLEGNFLLLVRAALTFGLASASYRFIESPIRAGALGQLWKDLREPSWARSRSGRIVGARAMVVAFAGAGLLAVAVVGPAADTGTLLDAASAISSPVELSGIDGGLAFTAAPGVAGTAATAEVVSQLEPSPATVAMPMDPNAMGPPTFGPPTSGPPTSNPATVDPSITTTTAAPAVPTVEPAPTPVADPAAALAASPVTAGPGGVTAIGDSVLLAAKPALEAAVPGIVVDAVIGRQITELIELAQQMKDSGRLAPVVIVQAGNNGPVSAADLDRLFDVLDQAQKVLMVNVEVPRPWESSNNRNMADVVAKRPRAVLVDWHDTAASAGDIFYKDGTHLRPTGIALYTALIKSKL